MQAIDGPFARDPNVRSAVIQFDDLLWVLHRPALDAGCPEGELGSVELHDVRAFRSRPLLASDTSLHLALPLAWAVELDETDYLRSTIAEDPQRPSTSFSQHRHFAVPDGNGHVLDVIARSAVVRTHGVVAALDVGSLFLAELALLEQS